jgi:hypothetical protein
MSIPPRPLFKAGNIRAQRAQHHRPLQHGKLDRARKIAPVESEEEEMPATNNAVPSMSNTRLR